MSNNTNKKKLNLKWIIMIALSTALIILVFAGILISEIIKTKKNDSSTSTSSNDFIVFQSKIVTSEKSFNIDEHPNIKRLAYRLEKSLLSNNINILSISFEESIYNDGKHNTVHYIFDKSIESTMKFNDDYDMNGINVLDYDFSDKNDKDYNDVIYALLHFDYFELTNDQITKCFELKNDENEIIGKYLYERNAAGYFIFDKKNFEEQANKEKTLSSEGTIEKEETNNISDSSNTSSGVVNTPEPEPTPEPKSTYGYESIYNEYSARLRNECPSLSLMECAELANEGVGKMASYMWSAKGNDGQYATYSDWATKLYNVYYEAAM